MKSYQWLLFLGIWVALIGCEQQEEVIFSCEINSNTEYVTRVKNGGKTRELIVWERTNFLRSGFPPQRRCQEVTERLQTAYNSGTLKTITWGNVQDAQGTVYKTLCTTRYQNCDTLLLTLLDTDDADSMLRQLANVLNGYAADSFRNDGSCTYRNNSPRLSCSVDILRVFERTEATVGD
jgi:hypothetical protein